MPNANDRINLTYEELKKVINIKLSYLLGWEERDDDSKEFVDEIMDAIYEAQLKSGCYENINKR